MDDIPPLVDDLESLQEELYDWLKTSCRPNLVPKVVTFTQPFGGLSVPFANLSRNWVCGVKRKNGLWPLTHQSEAKTSFPLLASVLDKSYGHGAIQDGNWRKNSWCSSPRWSILACKGRWNWKVASKHYMFVNEMDDNMTKLLLAELYPSKPGNKHSFCIGAQNQFDIEPER